uniref:Uncharacterized protein n=1 Tax=Tanacetum cinerariifolium TaxID=118510 RepID=A0A699WEQ0_TANCI|nr:hypothetical protein [Tanacetum cinerariifolium]
MNDTSSTVNHNAYIASAPQINYGPIAHHPSEFSSPETGLVVQVRVIWLSSTPNPRGRAMQNGSRTKYF